MISSGSRSPRRTLPLPVCLAIRSGLWARGSSTGSGVYVMLTPLPPGTHKVTFTGSFPEVGFTASATYTIVVTGR